MHATCGFRNAMSRRLSKILTRSAPAKTSTETQLALFPANELYCVRQPPARPIRLPKSILFINPQEELSDYLSRVAAAAMVAATKLCGTPSKAAVRLGTKESVSDDGEATQPPKLKLASNI